MTNTLELNYLNLGNHNFATLTLPASKEERKAFFDKLNPMDWDCELQWIELPIETKARYNDLSLSQLVELSEEVDDLEAFDHVFYACDSFNEALEKFVNGDYVIYNDCENDIDLGYECAVESGLVDPDSNDTLHRYFDFERFGQDIRLEGDFTRYDYNTLVQIIW